MLVAFINYLYYPVLGRIMTISDFGEVQALLSISNLGGVLMASFQIVVINITANNKATGASIISQFERLALIVVSLITTTMIIFSNQLQRFFDFSTNLPFAIVGITLVIGASMSMKRSFVQGNSNFWAVSVTGVIQSFSKLFFSTFLVLLGLQVFGAVAGILIAQIIGLAYIARVAQNAGYTSSIFKRIVPDFLLLRPEFRYLTAVMTAFFIATFFYSGDMLVVKRIFDPDTAGLYAGISAIARIIFFATASFAGVLLASAGKEFSSKHNYQAIKKSFIMVLAVGGAILLSFIIAPKQIVLFMIGEQYAEFAHLLPLTGLVMLTASIVNLFLYYYLALRRYIIIPISLTGWSITLLLTAFCYNTVEIVILNFLVGALAILLLILITGVASWLRASQIEHEETNHINRCTRIQRRRKHQATIQRA